MGGVCLTIGKVQPLACLRAAEAREFAAHNFFGVVVETLDRNFGRIFVPDLRGITQEFRPCFDAFTNTAITISDALTPRIADSFLPSQVKSAHTTDRICQAIPGRNFEAACLTAGGS
jgi:hypothetical protein